MTSSLRRGYTPRVPPPPPTPSPGQLICENGKTYMPARPFMRPPSSNGMLPVVTLSGAVGEFTQACSEIGSSLLHVIADLCSLLRYGSLPDGESFRLLKPWELVMAKIDNDPELVTSLLTPRWTEQEEVAWIRSKDGRTWMEYLLTSRYWEQSEAGQMSAALVAVFRAQMETPGRPLVLPPAPRGGTGESRPIRVSHPHPVPSCKPPPPPTPLPLRTIRDV